jgi:hypothetical protein
LNESYLLAIKALAHMKGHFTDSYLSQYTVETNELVVRFADERIENVSMLNIAMDGGQGIILQKEDIDEMVNEINIEIRGAGGLGSAYGWVSLSDSGRVINMNQTLVSFPVQDFNSIYGLNLTLGELMADGVLYSLELVNNELEIKPPSDTRVAASSLIVLYPNPGNDFIYIKLPMDIEKVDLSIKDILGRDFGTYQNISSNAQINAQDLPKGPYIITIKNDELNESRIWIKQ